MTKNDMEQLVNYRITELRHLYREYFDTTRSKSSGGATTMRSRTKKELDTLLLIQWLLQQCSNINLPDYLEAGFNRLVEPRKLK